MAEKKHEKYAHLLQTLISAKRGDLKCAIYTKDVYRANMARASSDNIIIFVGSNDISNAALPSFQNQGIDKYGLIYGWHGTRAKLFTRNKFWLPSLYSDFVSYYNGLYKNFEKEIHVYQAKEGVRDALLLVGLGLIGLSFRFLLKRNEIAKQQFDSCVMLFFNDGLDRFIRSATSG